MNKRGLIGGCPEYKERSLAIPVFKKIVRNWVSIQRPSYGGFTRRRGVRDKPGVKRVRTPGYLSGMPPAPKASMTQRGSLIGYNEDGSFFGQPFWKSV
jgi:hypothetical protein